MADLSIKKLVILALLTTIVDGSHFRGGTISWKYLGQSDHDQQVEINFRFGWRRDYNSPPCDDAMIQNMSLSYESGGWTYHNLISYNSTNQTTTIICTAYDIEQAWAYGYNSFVLSVNTSGTFYIRYTGKSWISGTVSEAEHWGMTIGNIDLDTRSDTGLVNNPPISFSAPIIRLTQGCPDDIVITYHDDDEDIVTCRYAISGADPDECGSACNGLYSTGYTHFSLNETTCTITYDGAGGTVLVAVSLVLEDHPKQDIIIGGSRNASTSDYLSQIPLQFIVEVVEETTCNVVPTYPIQTINDNVNITIPYGSGLNRTLYAYSSSNTTRISQFVVIGPLGMQTHPVTSVGTNLYSSQLTWLPDSDQSGTYDVCYYAIDTGGSAGEQICFATTVSDFSSPCASNNGGCSDICTSTGVDRICSCSMPCWNLDIDGATCLPEMAIRCNGQALLINMPECASNKTIVAGNSREHFEQVECQSTIVDETHQLVWDASTCGVSYQVNPVQIQYAGNLWVWQNSDDPSSVIARGHYRRVPVTCVLSSATDVSASFIPELPISNESFPVEINMEGFGTFFFYFDFYKTSQYLDVITPSEYPMTVSVNDRIYFAVGAIGQSGFIFFTQECVATASSDSDQSLSTYTFLQEGCLLDPTLIRTPSNNTMEDRLSMQAFDFASKLTEARANADISLQCTVMICDGANTTSRCYQGCVPSKRKKRSVSELDIDDEEVPARPTRPESPLQRLRGRFVLTGDIPGPTNTAEYLYWALIATGTCIFIILLYILYRVVHTRQFSDTKGALEHVMNSQNKAPGQVGGSTGVAEIVV